jgi:hypothetical protein
MIGEALPTVVDEHLALTDLITENLKRSPFHV